VERSWLRHYDNGVPATTFPSTRTAVRAPRRERAKISRPAGGHPRRPKFLRALLISDSRRARQPLRQCIDPARRPGRDRIALHLPNLPQFILCFHGALKAGAAVVAVNPVYTTHELARVIKNAEPKAVVTLPRLALWIGEALENVSGVAVIVTEPYDFCPWPWRRLARWRDRRYIGSTPRLRLTTLLHRASPCSPRGDGGAGCSGCFVVHRRDDRHTKGRHAHAPQSRGELHADAQLIERSPGRSGAVPGGRCHSSTCTGLPSGSRCSSLRVRA